MLALPSTVSWLLGALKLVSLAGPPKPASVTVTKSSASASRPLTKPRSTRVAVSGVVVSYARLVAEKAAVTAEAETTADAARVTEPPKPSCSELAVTPGPPTRSPVPTKCTVVRLPAATGLATARLRVLEASVHVDASASMLGLSRTMAALICPAALSAPANCVSTRLTESVDPTMGSVLRKDSVAAA